MLLNRRDIVTLISFPLIACLFSCSSGLHGKIEKRKDGEYYLVNTSETKIFQFTVKTTKVIADTAYSYYTELIILNPGDEKSLGAGEGLTDIKYRYDKRLSTYPLPSDTSTVIPVALLFLNDTIINGVKMRYEYVEDKVPMPQQNIKWRYEVTGQREIDPTKKQYFDPDTPE